MRAIRAITLICLFIGFGASSSFAQQDTGAIVKERVIDKKFWAVGAGLALSTVYDIEATQRALRSCSGGCREANPIARILVTHNRPTAYAVSAAVNAGVMYIVYRLKKKNHKTWWISPTAVIAVHTAAGSSNLRFVR